MNNSCLPQESDCNLKKFVYMIDQIIDVCAGQTIPPQKKRCVKELEQQLDEIDEK